MSRRVVFDVNETLLDLAALDDRFEELFDDATVRRTWFDLVLRNSMTLTVTGDYADFVTVARASLEMVGRERGVRITDQHLADIGEALRTLPPHADVVPALDVLRSAGCVIAAMTNSPQATADAQLTNAGIIDSFDRVMSVALVERFKPHPAVYKVAAARLAVSINEMTMVAAHDWDIAGAMAAGARGALVLRDGVTVNPLYPRPTITGSDLVKVAEAIVG